MFNYISIKFETFLCIISVIIYNFSIFPSSNFLEFIWHIKMKQAYKRFYSFIFQFLKYIAIKFYGILI